MSVSDENEEFMNDESSRDVTAEMPPAAPEDTVDAGLLIPTEPVPTVPVPERTENLPDFSTNEFSVLLAPTAASTLMIPLPELPHGYRRPKFETADNHENVTLDLMFMELAEGQEAKTTRTIEVWWPWLSESV